MIMHGPVKVPVLRADVAAAAQDLKGLLESRQGIRA
jgi:hypothetical protein